MENIVEYIKDEDYIKLRNNEKYEIIKYIVNICEKYNIPYFAFSNLLIGAVYYEDFVPDFVKETTRLTKQIIDIGFLRDDYETFLRILKEENNDDIQLEIFDPNINIPRLILRVKKYGVLFQNNKEYTIPFYVNVSPFDKVPENFDIRENFYREIRKLNTDYQRIYRAKASIQGNTTKKNYILKKLLYKWKDANLIIAKENKLIKKYDNSNSQLYARLSSKISKKITYDQIFPLQKRKFRDIYINIPNDYSNWTVDLNEEITNRIQAIQKVDLEIIKEFDRVCRLLNIDYFICGGTLLGYVRHGGFIPWDDDIDVGMLRKDYDYFINNALPYLDKKFFLQTRASDPNIPYLFSKIRMNDTLYVTEYNSKRDFHKGICLDLFPFDAIPKGEEKQMEFYRHAKRLSVQHHKYAGRKILEPEVNETALTNDELKIINYERKKRKKDWKRDLDVTYKKYINYVTQYNDKVESLQLDTVASFVPSYTYIKYEDLLPIKDVEFEGLIVKCMQKPEVFLEMQYGDYLKLPPKHLQCGHPLIEWSVGVKEEGE